MVLSKSKDQQQETQGTMWPPHFLWQAPMTDHPFASRVKNDL